MAQKVTGELMWMVTKSRPDLMFLLAKMSQSTLKSPREVASVARQAWKYLRRTGKEGIWLRRKGGEELEVYTDSSYGPNGMDSQGCVVVCYGGDVVMWKSSRQSTPSLSTAESELIEAIEGLTMGDSVDVLIQEISGEVGGKKILVDNMAAVNLLTEPAGSWRTRHLRLRAAHLRWRLGRLDWLVEQVPGAEQIAHVGTKVMTSPKLEAMKKMMNMGLRKVEDGGAEDEKIAEDEDKEEKRTKKEVDQGALEDYAGGGSGGAEHLVRMLVMMAALKRTRAEEGKGEESLEEKWSWKEIALVVIGLLITHGLLRILWKILEMIGRGMRRAPLVQPEEEPGLTEEGSEEPEVTEVAEGSAHESQREGRVHEPQEAHQREERVPVPPEGSMVRRNLGGRIGQQRPPTVASQAMVVINTWEPTDQFLRGRGPAFITTFGVRWHPFSNCPRLGQRTSPLISSQWCQHCSSQPRPGDVAVYGFGRGEVVHYDRNCPYLRIGSQKFMRCMVCAQMEV